MEDLPTTIRDMKGNKTTKHKNKVDSKPFDVNEEQKVECKIIGMSIFTHSSI